MRRRTPRRSGAGGRRAALAALVCLTLLLPALAAPMEDTTTETIFVAGNPQLYPLEYYDGDNDRFVGVLPSLLERIGAEYGIEFEYLHPETGDRRRTLAKNGQVELVSGLVGEEAENFALSGWSEPLLTMDTGGGERQPVRIGWTEIARPELAAALEAGLSQVSGRTLAELTLDHAEEGQLLTLRIWLLAAIFAGILLVILGVLLYLRRKKQRAAQVARFTDPLTGYGNQDYYIYAFQQFISDKNRVLYCVVYFGVDMERLRQLCGTTVAGQMLQEVAEVIDGSCAAQDILARVGEGGFALIRRFSSREDLSAWLERLFERFHRMDRGGACPGGPPIQAGAYILANDDRDPSTALFNAEQGFWQAREKDRDYAEAEAGVLEAAHQMRRNLLETQKALDEGQFRLFLQPLVAAGDGRIIGAEALVRWEHPYRGILGPGEFIPLMEKEGTVVRLDYYVLEQVCALLTQMEREGLGELSISCNFSLRTVDAPGYWEKVTGILDRYDFRRERLVVEVTEGLLSSSPEARQHNLQSLQQAGVDVALDDFGSGYASFRDMATRAYRYVTLDQSILAGVGQPFGREVLQGLIELGHRLELRILCKGVERQEQAQLLADMGCDMLQGYYFCRPLPAQEALRYFLKAVKGEAL